MSTTPGTFMTFPKSVGDLTITGSSFYDAVGSSLVTSDVGIPFIDIVFQ